MSTPAPRTTLRRGYKFTVAPEHLIFDRRLSDRAVRLWLILDRLAAGREVTFPSRGMLAEALPRTGLGEVVSLSSVDRAVRELCDAGWLAKERANRGDVNAYVLLEAPVVTSDDSPRTDPTPRHPRREVSSPMTTPLVTSDDQGETGDQETRTPPPTEGPPTAAVPRKRTPRGAVPASFAEWWAAYPRKTEKAAAEKAYVKALALPGVTAQVLLDGARRYAADPTRDPAFTKHPPTWLNRGCWEDEGPVRPSSTQVDVPAAASRPMSTSERFAEARRRATEGSAGVRSPHADDANVVDGQVVNR